jgi:hypothetical protein
VYVDIIDPGKESNVYDVCQIAWGFEFKIPAGIP